MRTAGLREGGVILHCSLRRSIHHGGEGMTKEVAFGGLHHVGSQKAKGLGGKQKLAPSP